MKKQRYRFGTPSDWLLKKDPMTYGDWKRAYIEGIGEILYVYQGNNIVKIIDLTGKMSKGPPWVSVNDAYEIIAKELGEQYEPTGHRDFTFRVLDWQRKDKK